MATEDFRGHPSPLIKTEDIHVDEMKWCNIGSGMFANTFKIVDKLPLTSKGGPIECDIHRRIVRSVSSGDRLENAWPARCVLLPRCRWLRVRWQNGAGAPGVLQSKDLIESY